MKFLKNKRNIFVVLSVLSICGIGIVLDKDFMDKSITRVIANEELQDKSLLYSIPSSDKVFINGIVKPEKSQVFEPYSQDNGTMENIKVQSGEFVDKGTLLFSYRNKDKELDSLKKEKEVSSAESKIKELQKNATDNREEIIYLSTKVKDLKREIEQIKSDVVSNVYAPFAGEVHIEAVSNDDDTRRDEVRIILDERQYYLDALVTEQDLSKLIIGSSVDVYMFATKSDRNGTITDVSKRPVNMGVEDNANLSKYSVKIEFSSQEELVNGYHAQAKLTTRLDKIEIPVTAIMEEEDKKFVLVNEMGVAKKREIKSDYTDTASVAVVISGLNEGEEIVKDIKNSKIKEGDSLSFSSDINFDDK